MNGKPLTQEEEVILYTHYPKTDTADLMALMPGRTLSQIYQHANKRGLKKDAEWLKSKNTALVLRAGVRSRFKKGHEPHNQGKIGFRASPKSEFKKGQLPANTLYDGAISIRKDTKSGRSYKYVRVAKAKWELLHRQVWISAKGRIPPKHVVAFVDGNTLNCALENLELITCGENLRRNNVDNGWKRSYAYREKQELGMDPTGAVTLSDSYVAGIIAKGDKKAKAKVLKNKELVVLKRKMLQLNRTIKTKKDEKRTDNQGAEKHDRTHICLQGTADHL